MPVVGSERLSNEAQGPVRNMAVEGAETIANGSMPGAVVARSRLLISDRLGSVRSSARFF